MRLRPKSGPSPWESAAQHLDTPSPQRVEQVRFGGEDSSFAQPLQARPAGTVISGAVTWSIITDTLRQGVIAFDGRRRLVLVNPRFLELYGFSATDLRIGMSFEDVAAVLAPAEIGAGMPAPDVAWCKLIALNDDVTDVVLHLPTGRVIEVRHVLIADGGWVATHDDITARFRAEEALRDKAELLDAALDAMREKTGLLQLAQEAAGAGLFDFNLVEDAAHLSPESLKLFNLPEDRTTSIRPEELAALVHVDDLADIRLAIERAKTSSANYQAEFRIPQPDRADRWIHAIGRVMTDDAGRAVRIIGLNIDVTERKHVEDTLRANQAALSQSEERFALAMDAGSDGLWDCNCLTEDVWYSDRWQTMLGYTPGELPGRMSTLWRLLHPDDRERSAAQMADHIEGRSASYDSEHRLLRKDGTWGWVLARGKVVARAADNTPLRIVGTIIDIGARKAAEAQVAYMASHDVLTDLPNRRLFRERLDRTLEKVRRDGRQCAVLCLDLDRFKSVNDRLGHLAGDALLRTVADRLKTLIRAEDMLARLGGDEFAILLDCPVNPDQVGALAERLIETTSVPVVFGAQRAVVGLSIGISMAPAHSTDSDELLNRADLALYRAKAEGRNTHRMFEPVMDDLVSARRDTEHDLRMALRGGEFILHFQPQVRGNDGGLLGFEALVRWIHPIRGLVMPGAFIALAEETGLIVDIGAWVLRTACREASRWPEPLKVAVNVSPCQFQHADLADIVGAALIETGLTPARLEIEITEGVIINDMARALDVVRRLKGLGVRVAMDDFGTGHSSLATLQAVPFDTIKIDRSFVGNVEDSQQAAAIVRAVLGLGRSLGIGVIAEGVETEGQRQFLIGEACDEMQGFLFGRPQPIENYAALMDGRRVDTDVAA